MEKQIDFGNIGIGTKENVALKPAKVKIISYSVEMQFDSNGKDVGNKATITCKHPDKTENIGISSVSFKKGKEIKTSGLWVKLDEDGLIPKQSALASFLSHISAKNLSEIVGKDVDTELDDKGYLTFKAY